VRHSALPIWLVGWRGRTPAKIAPPSRRPPSTRCGNTRAARRHGQAARVTPWLARTAQNARSSSPGCAATRGRLVRDAASTCSTIPTAVHPAAGPHHGGGVVDSVDVGQRIAGDGEQVGTGAADQPICRAVSPQAAAATEVTAVAPRGLSSPAHECGESTRQRVVGLARKPRRRWPARCEHLGDAAEPSSRSRLRWREQGKPACPSGPVPRRPSRSSWLPTRRLPPGTRARHTGHAGATCEVCRTGRTR
jgi:hypothetical protein